MGCIHSHVQDGGMQTWGHALLLVTTEAHVSSKGERRDSQG